MTSHIISYDPKYKKAFHDITMAWLAKDFTVEPQHIDMLLNPERVLLEPGGDVFFAVEDGKAVGTVAMKSCGGGVFELTKLGVDPAAKGSGYGRKLCERVIESFVEKKGKRLFLESHSMLEAAMAIYKKLGFELAENPNGAEYLCTNCYMEWRGCPDDRRVKIEPATDETDIAAVKKIFAAFIEFLPIDMGFQGIDAEMASFPDTYDLLLLAKTAGKPVGAVALKKHDALVCEMKRLYVLPEAQGTGAGRKLCERLIKEARSLGYKTMLLDSLKRLEAAVALYRKLGFEEIEPYNFNPEDDVIYMRRAL